MRRVVWQHNAIFIGLQEYLIEAILPDIVGNLNL